MLARPGTVVYSNAVMTKFWLFCCHSRVTVWLSMGKSPTTHIPSAFSRISFPKIVALWIILGKEDVIRDPSDTALQTYIRRITGVDHLRWFDPEQASTVIESLKQWQARVGGGPKKKKERR